MKRLLYLLLVVFATVTFCPSCGEDRKIPDFDYEPIKPDVDDSEEEDEGEGDGEESGDDSPSQNETLTVNVANWDFEQMVDFTGAQGAWIKQTGWKGHNANVTYEPTGGYNGTAGIKIECTAETTDMPVSQTVTGLVPDKLYELSAMIKVKDITPDKGAGGNVGLYGQNVWTHSESFTGSHNWTKKSVRFIADKESVDIACRLGFSAGDSDGTAWFDNVKIESPSGIYHRESEHVSLYIDETLVNISNTVMDQWLAKLDLAYEAYCELFDFFVPFGGKKMIIMDQIIDAWAYAGYPILWNSNYVESTLLEVKNYNNTCFGILHEMGHNFAPGNYKTGTYESGNYNCWNWNEELFANFRMYYALEKHNFPIYLNGVTYNGIEMDSYYRDSAEQSWSKNNDLDGAGMMWPLCQMVKKYGWDPIKKTFKELYNLDPASSAGDSKWAKINYFCTVLSKHAGSDDILAEFLTGEQIAKLKEL